MGASKKEVPAGKKNFYNARNGKFVAKGNEGEEGVVERKELNDDGTLKTTHFEHRYDQISGTIKKVFTFMDKYKKNGVEVPIEKLTIEFHGEDETTDVLTMPFSGRYAYGFLARIPNISIHMPFELNIFDKKEMGKNKQILYVTQGTDEATGKPLTVKSAYTKEEPNGLPQLEEIIFKGKKEMDDSKRLDFFRERIKELDLKLNPVPVADEKENGKKADSKKKADEKKS